MVATCTLQFLPTLAPVYLGVLQLYTPSPMALGWEWPVDTHKPGCRVLLGVAVMCPADCKGVKIHPTSYVSMRRLSLSL